jgi:hypothetical protein
MILLSDLVTSSAFFITYQQVIRVEQSFHLSQYSQARRFA